MKTKKEFMESILKNDVVRNNLTKKQINDQLTSLLNNKWNKEPYTIQKNHRKLSNEIIKTANLFNSARNQKRVKKIIISVLWSKGSMQAMQTKAELDIYFMDGTFKRAETSKTGGWGYCKESTTLAEVFNKYLRYTLMDDKKRVKAPYGINKQQRYFLPYFSGGIGANCYYKISKYIGGTFEKIASTKTTDTYILTIKGSKK